MKEKIDTIPVNEAFESVDECPFCYLERQAERRALRYVAGPGASYMEPEVRAATDAVGFCPSHMQKLYDYGNVLGAALMLQTYYAGVIESFRDEAEAFTPPQKKPLFGKRRPTGGESWPQRLEKRVCSCYICDKIAYNMDRYYATFFHLLKEEEFRSRVEGGKGFCLRHFAELMEAAEEKLPNAHRDWFYEKIVPLMEMNLVRVKEDLDWLIAKYDYRNAGADWKNSRDALQRAMQKLSGIHPADGPYKKD